MLGPQEQQLVQSLRALFTTEIPLSKVRSRQLKLWSRLTKALPAAPHNRSVASTDEVFEPLLEDGPVAAPPEREVPFEVRVEEETLRLMDEDAFCQPLLLS